MPEITAIHIVMLISAAVIGSVAGWVIRGNRATQEKAAVNAGWQDQINAQRTEHERLTDQNKGLMEQINQYQASNKDAKNRAKELSEAVREAFARRDELQREIKNIRGNLEVAVVERDELQSSMNAHSEDAADAEVKDARIKKLKLELESWQGRLPPLIEKFRQRNEDAERLERELDEARQRIAELESKAEPGQTRIEPVSDPDALTDGRDASNDSLEEDEGDSIADADDPDPWPQVEEANDGEVDEDEDEDEENAGTNELADNHSRDNLKRIKGVGPAIEKTLNELGIFRFQQIADMSEYDIDRVANRLKGFRSRIYREDWIGQARELRDQASAG
ncbi:MAG: hypothetical protein K0U72_09065 [Gammaproteobacteria bacterium]|nr:hypothetical protein [Gammaproteobacteria bacterium]